jgi:hypothetical protein
VEGEFTQLCVYASQEQECPNTKCNFSHEPKKRRVCPMFHNPTERCPHNPCLLGHHEARSAYRASKAFAACKRLSEYKTSAEGGNENEAAESGANAADKNEASQVANPKPAPEATPKQDATKTKDVPAKEVQPAQATDFEKLTKESLEGGKQDEMKRLYQITKKLQSEFEALKKVTTDKDNQVRTLQTAMGTMSAENASLREENESECSVLDAYYKDVFEKRSSTRALIDLNAALPLDNAIEGSLTVLNVMFAKPLEFSNECKTVDLFTDRPQTRFAQEVASLQSLGLSTDNIEHAVFLRSYMQFQTDPSFCKDGILDNSSSVISLPPGGANAPRASVLKKTPKRFRNLFFTQKSSKRTTNVPNSALKQKEGGGLHMTEPLPSEVHLMLADFCQKNVHKNPAVPLISQFLTHVQNGLDSLDTALLRYSSPVYNICPLKVKAYKNGKQKVMKNKAHPVYKKWDSLISRTHFDAAYATTRVTFP